MSARSRGRHRFNQPEERDPVEAAAEDEVMDAFTRANTRSGLSKLAGLILKQREEALKPEEPAPGPPGRRITEDPIGLRPPTAYEVAILGGLQRRTLYGGTVEPWRVDERRRRSRAARKSRRINRLAAQR